MGDLRNDDKSAAAFWPLPGLLDTGESNLFRFDAQRACGSPRQDLVHRGDENVGGRDSGGSEDRERGASQHSCRKRDGRPRAFSYLQQASLGIYGGKL